MRMPERHVGHVPYSTRTMNLAHFVEQQARRLPDRPAVVWGETVWTWAAFDRRVKAMAAVFADHGVGHGDRLLVQSRNCNQMFESLFAALRLGAVWVPANFRGAPDDLAWMAELSGAKLLLCDAAFPEHATVSGPDTVLAIGNAAFGPDIGTLIESAGAPPPLAAVDRDDPAWFFFTSGTTGRPKASVLTHGQLGFVITNHLCDLVPGTTPDDASLVVAPLSHGAGIHQLLMVAKGAPTILTTAPKFDTAEIWHLVEKWRVTNMFTVPTILKMLVEAPDVAKHDHSSLRYVIYAGAPMYRSDQIRALEVLGPVIVQYFGLGEVTGNITVLPPYEHDTGDDYRTGTCGFPRTGMQVEIQDDAGRPCAPGETGEICVTGPAVFAGYWQNEEANAKSFRDGFFRTGDLGHMDAEGYVYITGRASDMYISGGSNIYPLEIEEKILQHPAISEVAVFGMPDPKWGEIGVAVASLNAGFQLDPDEIGVFLEGKMASYKIPRAFHIWDEIPKSGYGKMAKRLVREELERRMAEQT
ncbi:MAG: acyl-CoA synthetase [Pseudomonadota bacterium]